MTPDAVSEPWWWVIGAVAVLIALTYVAQFGMWLYMRHQDRRIRRADEERRRLSEEMRRLSVGAPIIVHRVRSPGQQEAPPPCQTGSDGASRPERGQP